MTTLKKRYGFTLVETVAALMLFLGTVTLLASAMASAVASREQLRETGEVDRMLSELLDTASTLDYEQIAARRFVPPDRCPGSTAVGTAATSCVSTLGRNYEVIWDVEIVPANAVTAAEQLTLTASTVDPLSGLNYSASRAMRSTASSGSGEATVRVRLTGDPAAVDAFDRPLLILKGSTFDEVVAAAEPSAGLGSVTFRVPRGECLAEICRIGISAGGVRGFDDEFALDLETVLGSNTVAVNAGGVSDLVVRVERVGSAALDVVALGGNTATNGSSRRAARTGVDNTEAPELGSVCVWVEFEAAGTAVTVPSCNTQNDGETIPLNAWAPAYNYRTGSGDALTLMPIPANTEIRVLSDVPGEASCPQLSGQVVHIGGSWQTSATGVCSSWTWGKPDRVETWGGEAVAKVDGPDGFTIQPAVHTSLQLVFADLPGRFASPATGVDSGPLWAAPRSADLCPGFTAQVCVPTWLTGLDNAVEPPAGNWGFDENLFGDPSFETPSNVNRAEAELRGEAFVDVANSPYTFAGETSVPARTGQSALSLVRGAGSPDEPVIVSNADPAFIQQFGINSFSEIPAGESIHFATYVHATDDVVGADARVGVRFTDTVADTDFDVVAPAEQLSLGWNRLSVTVPADAAGVAPTADSAVGVLFVDAASTSEITLDDVSMSIGSRPPEVFRLPGAVWGAERWSPNSVQSPESDAGCPVGVSCLSNAAPAPALLNVVADGESYGWPYPAVVAPSGVTELRTTFRDASTATNPAAAFTVTVAKLPSAGTLSSCTATCTPVAVGDTLTSLTSTSALEWQYQAPAATLNQAFVDTIELSVDQAGTSRLEVLPLVVNETPGEVPVVIEAGTIVVPQDPAATAVVFNDSPVVTWGALGDRIAADLAVTSSVPSGVLRSSKETSDAISGVARFGVNGRSFEANSAAVALTTQWEIQPDLFSPVVIATQKIQVAARPAGFSRIDAPAVFQGQSGQVSATLVDAAGTPLAGRTVTFRAAASGIPTKDISFTPAVCVTTSTGSCAVQMNASAETPPGPWTVTVAAADATGQDSSLISAIPVLTSSRPKIVQGETGSLEVRLSDAAGNPIPNAQIELEKEFLGVLSTDTLFTNDNGLAAVDVQLDGSLPPGELSLQGRVTSFSEYEPFDLPFEVVSKPSEAVFETLTDNLHEVLPGTETFLPVLITDIYGNPKPKAAITVTQAENSSGTGVAVTQRLSTNTAGVASLVVQASPSATGESSFTVRFGDAQIGTLTVSTQ